MNLPQVLLVAAASFLFTGEALTASTGPFQPNVSNVVSPSGTNQRLLRVHDTPTKEKNTSEERGFDKLATTHQIYLKKFAKELGFDLERALNEPAHFSTIPKDLIAKYHQEYMKIRKTYG
ncbi:Avirulence (Avh) protein [Phytophthora megakarya]|uniref:RxLR effector protein n=1 Tax=Phytophthora megakarya TaxID=4795 RepID=A0A225WJ17_9STRA|nr:Avirulence (Avh) protein [Phytophthora megakarya]